MLQSEGINNGHIVNIIYAEPLSNNLIFRAERNTRDRHYYWFSKKPANCLYIFSIIINPLKTRQKQIRIPFQYQKYSTWCCSIAYWSPALLTRAKFSSESLAMPLTSSILMCATWKKAIISDTECWIRQIKTEHIGLIKIIKNKPNLACHYFETIIILDVC